MKTEASTTNEQDDESAGDTSEADESPIDEEVAASFSPSLPTTLVTSDAGTSHVTYVERDGKRVAFGDIVLPSAPAGQQGVATAIGRVARWPGGVVPYVVSTGDRAAFEAGIALWETKTFGVRFVRRTNQADYIDVIRGDGCWSYIGRRGGRQELSLGAGCEIDHVAAHEIGHALGLWHEQSRADRDRFLTVTPQNAAAEERHNFDKLTFPSIGRFDFDSIMLYESFSFSNNGRATLVRKDGSEIFTNVDVSAGDAAGIETLYAGADAEETGPNPEPETPGETFATTTANLNLRTGPSTKYTILTTIPRGSVVQLTGDTSGSFVGVVYDGIVGWAHSSYLR